jgi:hypothetical protein
MLKYCVKAALAAGVMMCAASAGAEEAQAVDRTMTFAIPSHALASYVATLDAASDYSVFVDAQCPPELQRMALRRLWKMLPQETAESAYN